MAVSVGKGRSVFLLFIIATAVGVIGWGSPASKPEQCLNPPAGNPNKCHIYTWNNFPTDNTFTPITGLFSNDSSYIFSLNVTGIIGFTICTFASQPAGSIGNATITLQTTVDNGVTWENVDSLGGGTAGSDNLGSINQTPASICSLTVGDFVNADAICTNCPILFRIGGSTPGSTPICPCALLFEMLNVQFYYSTAFTSQTNTITCDSTIRSLTSFTNNCTIQIPRSVSTTVTFSWAATNETGTGCGAGDNCWRRNTGVTCTIAIGANSCSNTITFSPAFTTTTPIIIENWSPMLDGSFTIKPSSSVYNVLT